MIVPKHRRATGWTPSGVGDFIYADAPAELM